LTWPNRRKANAHQGSDGVGGGKEGWTGIDSTSMVPRETVNVVMFDEHVNRGSSDRTKKTKKYRRHTRKISNRETRDAFG